MEGYSPHVKGNDFEEGILMDYMDNCTACEEKSTIIEQMQTQLDDIRNTVEDYSKKRDHWEWDNLIDDIMGILES